MPANLEICSISGSFPHVFHHYPTDLVKNLMISSEISSSNGWGTILFFISVQSVNMCANFKCRKCTLLQNMYVYINCTCVYACLCKRECCTSLHPLIRVHQFTIDLTCTHCLLIEPSSPVFMSGATLGVLHVFTTNHWH